MPSLSERPDIPPTLLAQAAALGPSVLAALLASYPTDAEHATKLRRRRGQRGQMVLPLTDRGAA